MFSFCTCLFTTVLKYSICLEKLLLWILAVISAEREHQPDPILRHTELEFPHFKTAEYEHFMVSGSCSRKFFFFLNDQLNLNGSHSFLKVELKSNCALDRHKNTCQVFTATSAPNRKIYPHVQ